MKAPMRAIVICSGGLDSVTLAHKLAAEGELLRLVTFDYGQRHKREIAYAAKAAERLGCAHDIIDLSEVGAKLTGSALTDAVDVPDGHYSEQTMKITVVPNRNAIMLTVAFGLAVSAGADTVATAIHGGDHFIYPDCRPPFAKAFAEMQRWALDEVADVGLYTPFIGISKAAIVTEGTRLGVPFAETWSCYKGGEVHCGRCGTCVERREAFHLAGVADPTEYLDDAYWQEACARIDAERTK